MSKRPRPWPETPAPLPTPVTDNHTHLPVGDWEIPRAEGVKLSLTEQLHRAREAGVHRIITVGCALPDLDPTLEIAREYAEATPQTPAVRAALALHPNEAPLHAGVLDKGPDGLETFQKEHHIPLDEALAEVDKRLDDPTIVAVGETGIDLFRTAESGLKAAKESFAAHLQMGFARDLPVQIHDRDAHQECVDVLYDVGADKRDTPIVFHCFSGGVELAEHCAKNGWYASFGGSLTFKANDELREAFRVLPPELIVIETDAPYLTPVPHRGQPNASYVMPLTVRFMADLWEVSEDEACERLENNTRTVYGDW
ncbi:MAG: TatD family hydrolase [Actinomycetaceae bacterium]|nr:TatD family hydrolase [Actinomycetaceae bacterium]